MSCWKYYFATKKEARAKRKRFENKFWNKLSIYKCKYCNGYHYTTDNIEVKIYYRVKKMLKNLWQKKEKE